MPHRETADMHLQKDALFPRGPRLAVAVPGKRRLDHPAFRHLASAIPPVEGKILTWAAEPVAEQCIAAAQLPGNRLGVGIEEELVVVEPMTCGGIIRSVDA